MATTLISGAAPGPEEDLSDEQIHELLARASARLKSKSVSAINSKSSELQKYTLPKLDAGELESGYVSTQGDLAVMDGSRLVDSKLRKQANGVRKVEDPIMSRKDAEEVGAANFLTFAFAIMRKIQPSWP